MKKVSRIITSASTLALAALLAACGANGGKGGTGSSYVFDMWTGFGSDYTDAIEGVVDTFNESHQNIEIVHTRKKDYNTLRTEILNSRSQKAYPNFACGYPDHFADYNEEKFLLSLDDYIARYNEEHKAELTAKGLNSIVDDYYPEYMEENKKIAYDDDGNPLTVGLPFNKSTEVLVCNGYYFDYFKSINDTIKVPETWDELGEVNTKIQAIIVSENLTDANSKYIIGRVPTDIEGHASDFEVVSELPTSGDKVLIQNITELTSEQPFFTLGYDSGENAFITLLHQWGVPYTTEENGGKALFWTDANKAATTAVLQYFKDLNTAGAFAVPESFGGSELFCTKFLDNGRCLFTLGSSGGLSKPHFTNYSLRISAIPYHSSDKKLVISQGTSLGLFNKYVSKETYYEEMYNAFCSMVELTTGDLQASWVTTTGYFPASKSAYNSAAYQDLLTKTNPNRREKLYRDAGKINGETYKETTAADSWHKFVDPGFPASNSIRVNVGPVLHQIFEGGKTIVRAMDDAWGAIDAKLKP